MPDDPREAAARYRLARDHGEPTTPDTPESATAAPQRGSTAAERSAFVETAIQQAIRRGEFDDLPGAGKPLEGLDGAHDPDWWIRRKIASEQLTGLGPPALALRVEHAEMTERLDTLTREQDVREAIADFNHRVIEARRQLLGGPPVITPTRDADVEVAAWIERRAERVRQRTAASSPADHPTPPRSRWWRRPRSR